jgi:hypothetical protein
MLQSGPKAQTGASMRERTTRIMALLGAGICITALALQLALMLSFVHDRGGGTLTGLWRFLGFFTNVTNILAALVLAHAALRPRIRTGLGAPWVEAMATASIIMAGILNAVLLSHFNPQGLRKLADLGLHEIAPFAVTLFWLLRPHGGLGLKDALLGMSWPSIYCAYALLRGAADGWYPYYFLDPAMLGLNGLALSVLGLGIAFLAASLALIGVDRLLGHGDLRGLASERLGSDLANSLLPLGLAGAATPARRPAAAFAGLDEADGPGGG